MKYFKIPVLLVIILFYMNALSSHHEYVIGDKVKPFKLRNIDGKFLSLDDFKEKKGAIVVFTCNTCPFAIAYEDRIIALNKKYAEKGFPVIAINPNDTVKQKEDSFKHMKKRWEEKGLGFPYLQDITQQTAKDFGASKTPHVYVLQNNNGAFHVRYIGGIDNNSYQPKEVTEKYVEKAIDELLAGKEVSQNTTKAIGCTIKWKDE